MLYSFVLIIQLVLIYLLAHYFYKIRTCACANTKESFFLKIYVGLVVFIHFVFLIKLLLKKRL